MKPQCGTISCSSDWHYLIQPYNTLENNLTIKLKVEVLQLLGTLPRNSCTCAKTHKKNVYYSSACSSKFLQIKICINREMDKGIAICSQFGKQYKGTITTRFSIKKSQKQW